MFAQISRLVFKVWLSHCPSLRYIIYDNGSAFKLHYAVLYQVVIECKPTKEKRAQANTNLECLHGVLRNILHTAWLGSKTDLNPADIEKVIIDTAWAACSAHHTVLGSFPGFAVFGKDMLFHLFRTMQKLLHLLPTCILYFFDLYKGALLSLLFFL